MTAAVTKPIVTKNPRSILRVSQFRALRPCIIGCILALVANVATAQVTLSMPDTSVSPSTSVSVPIRVTGFNHVGSFSLTITFDRTVLTYAGVGNQPASGSLFSTPPATANANGSVSISWFDPSHGLNIGSGTLLNVLFAYGSGSSALTFTNITPSSITDSLATNMPASFTNGRVKSLGLPPNTPTLVLPSNGATNQAPSLTISWNPSSGATTYRLQVSTDPAFGTNIVDDATLTSPSRLVSSLTSGTTYYWRVSATNGSGSSVFSQAWSFTTIVVAPGAPSLVSPANGATASPLAMTLTWNASPGATKYRLQIATDAIFTSMVLDDSTLTVVQRAVGPLSNNVKYFWRVNAANVGGTSQYSAVWNFTTLVAPPAAPSLLSPVDNAINISLTPTLTWNPLSEATYYELQVSAFSNFPDYVYDDTTSGLSRTIGPLNLGTSYYWRVRARNGGGFGSFSSARAFKTILTSAVENLDGAIPREFALSQNYPNPFNPTTSFEFQVASSSTKSGSASGGEFVTLKIFDILGREVATLVNEACPAGVYTVRWDASSLPSGVYFSRLQAGSFTASRTMTLMK